ncbi:MAG: hypothetical protein PVF82_02765 [Gammaproteobacteria bacterium]
MLSSRRDFLSFVTLNAAKAAVAAIALPAPLFAISQVVRASTKNPLLGFADRHGLGPDMDAPDVERLCCPLHEEKLLPESSVDQKTRQAVKEVLKSEFHNANLGWQEDYKVGFTYQHYGVPDDSEQTIPLLKYCHDAGEYSHAKLQDIFDEKVTWDRLTHEKSVVGLPAFHGFVGRYTYYVTRAVISGGQGSTDLPYLVQSWPVERAIHYIVAGNTAVPKPKRGTLYIIPGTTSLVAPFSELLHLTFHEPSQRYAAELAETMQEDQAHEQARIAGETVNEAVAIVLASEFIKKLGQSDRLSTIHFMANNLADTYHYLPKAIAFVKRTSVQNAVDIYFDSPAKFMARIENA